MTEQPTFVYLLMSTVWLAVLFGGCALLIKLWLPGRREHKERMKAMEIEAKRLTEAEHARKIGMGGIPASLPESLLNSFNDSLSLALGKLEGMIAHAEELFRTPSSPTVPAPPETESATGGPTPESLESAVKVSEAMTQLNDAVVQVQEAVKVHVTPPSDISSGETPK